MVNFNHHNDHNFYLAPSCEGIPTRDPNETIRVSMRHRHNHRKAKHMKDQKIDALRVCLFSLMPPGMPREHYEARQHTQELVAHVLCDLYHKWLNGSPREQQKATKLFQTRFGFHPYDLPHDLFAKAREIIQAPVNRAKENCND